jgi:hypothetical protein
MASMFKPSKKEIRQNEEASTVLTRVLIPYQQQKRAERSEEAEQLAAEEAIAVVGAEKQRELAEASQQTLFDAYEGDAAAYIEEKIIQREHSELEPPIEAKSRDATNDSEAPHPQSSRCDELPADRLEQARQIGNKKRCCEPGLMERDEDEHIEGRLFIDFER